MRLRLLFLGPEDADGRWRAGFDWAQAAAAFDYPLQLGFADRGLELLQALAGQPPHGRAAPMFSSLSALGLEAVYAPLAQCQALIQSTLPVVWLGDSDWRDWLRAGDLRVWS